MCIRQMWILEGHGNNFPPFVARKHNRVSTFKIVGCLLTKCSPDVNSGSQFELEIGKALWICENSLKLWYAIRGAILSTSASCQNCSTSPNCSQSYLKTSHFGHHRGSVYDFGLRLVRVCKTNFALWLKIWIHVSKLHNSGNVQIVVYNIECVGKENKRWIPSDSTRLIHICHCCK